MAFPDYATSVSDAFTRADETPATGWTVLGGSSRVVSNQFAANLAASNNFVQWGASDYANAEAVVTINTLDADGGIGFRGDYRFIEHTTGAGLKLEFWNGGSYDNLGSWVGTFTAGEKLGVSANGTAIKCYHFTGGAWNLRVDVTHSGASTGWWGIYTSFNTGRYDDWSIAEIPLPGASLVSLFSDHPKPVLRGATL